MLPKIHATHTYTIYTYIFIFFFFSFSSFVGSERVDRQYISEFTIHIVICSRRRKNWIGSLPSIHCCFGGLCASLSPFLPLCRTPLLLYDCRYCDKNLLYIIKNTFPFWTQITCSHSRTTHLYIYMYRQEEKGSLIQATIFGMNSSRANRSRRTYMDDTRGRELVLYFSLLYRLLGRFDLIPHRHASLAICSMHYERREQKWKKEEEEK